MNLWERMVVCGLISGYNVLGAVPGPANLPNVPTKRLRVQGFIVRDYAPRFPEAAAQSEQWLKDGNLKCRIDLVEGLRSAPTALNKLFDGANIGKLMVKVSEESS